MSRIPPSETGRIGWKDGLCLAAQAGKGSADPVGVFAGRRLGPFSLLNAGGCHASHRPKDLFELVHRGEAGVHLRAAFRHGLLGPLGASLDQRRAR